MTTLLVDTLSAVQWEPWPAPLVPPGIAVFRYLIRADDQPWLYELLQTEEIDRAARFRQVADRQRFIAGRGWLRMLAGQLSRQSPQQVRFSVGPSGKPSLVLADGSVHHWHINVSHSGDWVLLAVGSVPVGVDVEWIRPNWPFQDLVETSFNAHDQAQLAASPTPRDLFYTLWTRKESLFKATGKGLTNDFMSISASKGVHQVVTGLPEGSGTWSIRSFTVAHAYVGAVACHCPVVSARFFTLDKPALGCQASLFGHQ
ncbi:4'-phosphopantetheinyl transferase family protein [Fibrella arboris]|uniref:4'-phosphopantetheinyl transferase family protein n=1 Tax=Fibrella arboris TaxID=3242486 RepID=UPI003521537C